MNEISIGAVGGAVIAGLVTLLGLVISKEQKVSEFRQSWIDQLRVAMVTYLVQINAISDMIRLRKAGRDVADDLVLQSYRELNQAAHSIKLRVNAREQQSDALLKNMAEFEELAKNNDAFVPVAISKIEAQFLAASQSLLKYEWSRVKRGEPTFVWTKRIVVAAIAGLLIVLGYLWVVSGDEGSSERAPSFQLANWYP